jgi:uncharacterized protein YecE (DUF72 family)
VNIHCGIAGWSYRDWEGWVYPGDVREKLRYVAPFVDMAEVNSTFYRPPSASTAASWAEQTAACPGFFFSAKLHRDVTHGGRIEDGMVAAFRDGLRPLTERGMLRHLLAQFRHDVADRPDTREHLRKVRDRFGGIANLVVELRHVSWQEPEALAFLSALGVTVCNLDYPVGPASFDMPVSGVGRDAYFRLHGRNAKAWFDSGAGRDQTYNYCYSQGELKGIADRARSIGKMSRSLTLVANNHFRGQELVNTIELRALLTGRRQKVPPLLARRYPRLRAVADPDSERLDPQTGQGELALE